VSEGWAPCLAGFLDHGQHSGTAKHRHAALPRQRITEFNITVDSSNHKCCQSEVGVALLTHKGPVATLLREKSHSDRQAAFLPDISGGFILAFLGKYVDMQVKLVTWSH
jgi:hypothetical protein